MQSPMARPRKTQTTPTAIPTIAPVPRPELDEELGEGVGTSIVGMAVNGFPLPKYWVGAVMLMGPNEDARIWDPIAVR